MRALSLALLLASTSAIAQTSVDPAYSWPPPASRATIKLWPGTPPDAMPSTAPETDTSTPTSEKIAGRPLVRLGHVSTPTLTVFPAEQNPSGAAVVVFPGGGYSILAIDLEGTEVCQWLNSIHVTCFVLKYRVPDTGPFPKSSAALDDAERALSLVRAHAADWHLNPARIGALGFSAGAHLAAALSTADHRLYPPVDPADQTPFRPDFALVLYPGYLAEPPAGQSASGPGAAWSILPRQFTPNTNLHPTASTPPTFLLQAEDDPVHVENALTWFEELKAAHVPAELHLYAAGGHGYGLRPTDLPVTHWPTLATTWLGTIGVLPPSSGSPE